MLNFLSCSANNYKLSLNSRSNLRTYNGFLVSVLEAADALISFSLADRRPCNSSLSACS